jgi:hypothetical protein
VDTAGLGFEVNILCNYLLRDSTTQQDRHRQDENFAQTAQPYPLSNPEEAMVVLVPQRNCSGLKFIVAEDREAAHLSSPGAPGSLDTTDCMDAGKKLRELQI